MARKKKPSNNVMRHLITKLNPRSPISEQYRTIRTNVQFSAIDEALKSIVVTSSAPAEGKSTVTANLAVVYAQQGKKVLLVDADMRKPTVHYTFRLDNLRGLSSILVGEYHIDQVVEHSGEDHLDVISSGPVPPNPSELLATKRMRSFIEEATSQYDIVIFDTPPVLAVTDAPILADAVDGVLLVIRSGQTEIETAKKAMESLEPASGKLLGTVLNDREKQENTYYYYGAE